jgi:ABC-type multidrug transport system fused ATPase/permease subunit
MMSKQKASLAVITRIVFLVLLGVLMFTTGVIGVLILIVTVPVLAWYVIRLNERVAELEKKLADKEKKPGQP